MKVYTIKKIEKTNYPEALDFVWQVFREFEAPDYSREGIDEFYKSIHDENYLSALCMFGAYENGHLIGVIATRNYGAHIALFFVDGNHHRQGIGKRLFQKILERNTGQRLTVNSSPYAVPVYHKLGFRDVDTEQTVKGVKFTPMVYNTYNNQVKEEHT